ncbi:3-phosphoserine/phosphohydroxythreonine transaminase [Thiomicrorhabdus sp. 6S3-12]|uniref:3-phosphoserine/phosphohydroxythreonine transaminase n=1 Tax=Thiomicrorhabdus sp. 6S3-12 TaxID=2819681 RepID=UPI001AAD8EC7|nr:3-phosphoserine/phosphohydroxythreonine transaminase [Thiomicrorhabdus sp. 6S3-12]
MMRSFNFSAGPAMLPEAVMRKAQAEFLDWNDTTMSVMEMSHRSADYMALAQQMEADLREIMAIPDNYKVLFVHGGASLQFSAIPMNLTQPGDTVDYIDTGVWSSKAIKEARRFVNVNLVAGGESNPTKIPEPSEWQFSEDAKYIHICSNETITGLEFQEEQLEAVFAQGKPVIADMSSNIMCRQIDVSKYAMIYAGAQKNIGPAGLAILIVRDDLIGHEREDCPTLMKWSTYAENESMFNTPNTWAWYLAGLVFQWIKELGGIQAIEAINQRKAQKLYDYIDASNFYHNRIDRSERSWMNVTFELPSEEMNAKFLAESKSAGLLSLKGHRAFGGMRASIYNAMPEEGVDALIEFMQNFALTHA